MPGRLGRIGLLLMGSGFCALVYQSAWLRELRLVFGVSTAASAAVLAIFMGGLGLGGVLFGRRADRHPRPLALYGTLELLIATSAAVTPFLVDLSRAAYGSLGGTLALGLGLGTGVRMLLSVLVLAVPTVLMGGTLPAAARAAETHEDLGRRNLALLYGMNTMGAVLGAALGAFVLLEILGTRDMLWTAAALNAAVGLLALRMAGAVPAVTAHPVEPALAPAAPGAGSPPSGPSIAPPEADPSPLPAPAAAPPGFVYVSAAVVGFVFLLMELVWYRMLGPILGGSSYMFGLILAMALLGIGAGAAAYSTLRGSRTATLAGFALTCSLEALFMGLPLVVGDRLAILSLLLQNLGMAGFGGHVLEWAMITALVVLPAAFVSGVQFPMLIALLGQGRKDVGRETGLAYASNTAGSIVGSLAGGFGLMPLLTAPGTWRLSVVLLALLGLVAGALALLRRLGRPAVVIGPLLVATLALCTVAAEGPTAAWRHGGIGSGRAVLPSPDAQGIEDWSRQTRRFTLRQEDGVESSVALVTGDGLSLIINGKSDGNSVTDAGSFIMGGMMGVFLHPQPKKALVVGLGVGSSAGWMADVSGIERVDVVELEPAVLDIAKQCGPANRDVMVDPKVSMFIGDAREVLLTTRERYDVVFSQPSNPFRAGISSLFTSEFYQAVRQRLAPGGVFVQWLQAYEVDDRTVETVLATLGAVFPSVEVWRVKSRDLVLVASEEPRVLDVPALRRRLDDPAFRDAMWATWRVSELEGVLAQFLAGPAVARELAARKPDLRNTDDLPLIEFGFARTVGWTRGFDLERLRTVARGLGCERPPVDGGDVDWVRVDELRSVPGFYEGAAVSPIGDPSPDAQARSQFLSAWLARNLREAAVLWRRLDRAPRDVAERVAAADALAEVGDDEALVLAEPLGQRETAEVEAVTARLRFRQGRHAEAAMALEQTFLRLRASPWAFHTLMSRALRLAVNVARAAPAEGPRLFDALSQPFSVQVLQGERLMARVELARMVDLGPRCVEALADLEPQVPWNRDVLAFRARCYASVGHPLAATARDDLEAFLGAEPPVFGAGVFDSAKGR